MNMPRLRIYPGTLRGEVAAPPSKSMMQRVLAALLLRPASLSIYNAGSSADERVVMQVLRDAGFGLRNAGSSVLHIEKPALRQLVRHVEFGESGLAARMLIPILSLQDTVVRVDALPGLRARPISLFNDELPRLGVRTASNRGFLPGSFHGPLKPANIMLRAADTSQVLTGLLMAFSGAGASDVTISVAGLVSKPYIDLTLQVMKLVGLPLPRNMDYEAFCFPHEPGWGHAPQSITIEGDWSGAAFLLAAGAIAGPVTVSGLDAFSTQGDKAVLGALMDCGASVSVESVQVRVSQAPLKAFHFNATDCPDLFPPLAALACYAEGTSVIEGVGRLAHKESDRSASIVAELGRMGADISVQDDLMIVRGGSPLHGTVVSAHNDHRIAMMCAVAALGATGPTTIDGAGAVDKSYPAFWDDLQSLGAGIEAAG